MITKIIKKVACWFLPNRKLRHAVQLGATKEFFTAIYSHNKKSSQFPDFISVVAAVKNEGPYLLEWIEYHKLIGVNKFYIYDNESTDDIKKILEPYIQNGTVEYTYYPGKNMQIKIYHDAIKKHKYKTQWMAFIDLDEFIVPTETETLTDFLRGFDQEFSQLVIGWMLYGSSGHEKMPQGFVGDNYLYRGADNSHFLTKAIVNPRAAFYVGAHHAYVFGKTIDEYGNKAFDVRPKLKPFSKHKIRINHYHCKSWEEYEKRALRGEVLGQKEGRQKYTRGLFDAHDKNDIYDPVIQKYTSRIRLKLGG